MMLADWDEYTSESQSKRIELESKAHGPLWTRVWTRHLNNAEMLNEPMNWKRIHPDTTLMRDMIPYWNQWDINPTCNNAKPVDTDSEKRKGGITGLLIEWRPTVGCGNKELISTSVLTGSILDI
jgi:hypothetical protein